MTNLLETDRLIIKAPKQEDLQHYINLYMNRDVRRLMYTRAKDIKQIQLWLNQSIQHNFEHGFCVGSVFEKSTQQFIGRAGLTSTSPDADIQGVEVDCLLLPDYWRKGYGVELLKACFDWGFKQFKLTKIYGVIYAINIPSQKLAEKSGMKFIGNQMYEGIEFMWYQIQT